MSVVPQAPIPARERRSPREVRGRSSTKLLTATAIRAASPRRTAGERLTHCSAAAEWAMKGRPRSTRGVANRTPAADRARQLGLILNAALRVGGTFVLRPATGDSTRHIRSGDARRIAAS